MDFGKLIEKVDRERTLNLHRELVRIPSVSGKEHAISKKISKQLESMGVQTEAVGLNVVGRIRGSQGKPTLILNSHMDTVDVGNREDWHVDPFGAEIRDGKIYGRGAADDKGSLAAMIMAIDTILKARVELRGNLVFIADTWEEGGTEKVKERKGIFELIDSKVIQGDAALIGEPTALHIGIGMRSPCMMEVISKGKAAHGSRPHTGSNAIVKMAKLVAAIGELKVGHHEFLGSGSANVGIIEGGFYPTVVPDRCRIVLDRRLTMGETPESATEGVLDLIKKVCERDNDLKLEDFEVKVQFSWWPTLMSPNEPIVGTLRKAAALVLGAEPDLIPKKGHNNGGYIYHTTRVPVVIFGPGHETAPHSADECIEIEQVIDGVKIYTAAIVDFLGGTGA